ncbi:7-carboxy-7-deazaguanine synthase QueE [Terrimonas sp.]|uniref:7-carboxy-7-deazaguanine synthase QueE n=1 Tax=Terrimonas sp. TaxID=1914338 RepID=UPI000D50C34A|nr:7-carboxy-7-deazaguanine synthase QueE [Terrimonas sp.]
MEAFYTLQGEGMHQGKAAYFIRLGGCDVGCVWCDVKESWNANAHPQKETYTIITEALKEIPGQCASPQNNNVIAVVTGGEPLMHHLDELTTSLKQAGFRTHIETSGSSPLSGTWDWICLSPKKFKAPLPEILSQADELKVVAYNKSDFKWAEQFEKQVSSKCKLYLQPEWSKAQVMTPLIIAYIKEHPQWQLSLQVHKYLNIP